MDNLAPKFDNYDKKRFGRCQPLSTSSVLELNVTLDLLRGCSFSCPGCYVNKKVSGDVGGLERLNTLISKFLKEGFEANDIFLGPTDVFSTVNFDEVLAAKEFEVIVNHFKALVVTSTMMSSHEVVETRLERLSEVFCRDDNELEIFPILDIQKYLNGDAAYLKKFNENLELLDDRLGFSEINTQFSTNFHEDLFSNINFVELSERVRKDYGVKLRINPSFVHMKNADKVLRMSRLLKNHLEATIDSADVQNVFLNALDVHMGGETYVSLTFSEGKLYRAPFFYEFIPIKKSGFEISRNPLGEYSLEDVFSLQESSMVQQYAYAKETEKCQNCPFLSNCVSRQHLSFMEAMGVKECIVPQKLYKTSF